MKILLVDDDQALLTLFEATLKQEGFTTITAFDGKTGLDKARSEQPDLILLDQILPDMNGNDVLKVLKKEDGTKHLNVVILSNFGQNELIEEAINQGALEYILKYQIEPSDLVNKVKSLLNEAKNQPAKPQNPS